MKVALPFFFLSFILYSEAFTTTNSRPSLSSFSSSLTSKPTTNANVLNGFCPSPLAARTRNEKLDNFKRLIKITPDGSRDMEEYRRNVIDNLVTRTNDSELDGYQLFDLIVAKWGVAYGIEFRKLVFAGKPLLYLNVMWKYLGQDSFPLNEQEYLEHLQFISEKLIEWDKVKEVKEFVRDVRKKPNAYFGYAVSIPLNIDEETVAKVFPEEGNSMFGETK